MRPQVQLDYVSRQPTLHFLDAGQKNRMPKAAECSLVKQIIQYEKQYGLHPTYITYYTYQYDLTYTDEADLWLLDVWLKSVLSAYAHA